MPDLQTEIFTKVLPQLNNIKFDDEGESKEVESIVEAAPLTRQIFDYVKENPKIKGVLVLNHFQELGHKRSVVAATVQALQSSGRVFRLGHKLSVTRSEYEKPKVTKVTVLPKKVVQNKIAEHERKTEAFDVDLFMGTLSMYQGRELYLRLKAIYGG